MKVPVVVQELIEYCIASTEQVEKQHWYLLSLIVQNQFENLNDSDWHT